MFIIFSCSPLYFCSTSCYFPLVTESWLLLVDSCMGPTLRLANCEAQPDRNVSAAVQVLSTKWSSPPQRLEPANISLCMGHLWSSLDLTLMSEAHHWECLLRGFVRDSGASQCQMLPVTTWGTAVCVCLCWPGCAWVGPNCAARLAPTSTAQGQVSTGQRSLVSRHLLADVCLSHWKSLWLYWSGKRHVPVSHQVGWVVLT